MSRSRCFAVPAMSAPRTGDCESGSSGDIWNTPSCADTRPGRNPNELETRGHWGRSNNTGNLRDDVMRIWPMPVTTDASASGNRNLEGSKAHPGTSLTDAVHGGQAPRIWPTPNQMDADRGAESRQTKKNRGSGGVNLREACNWASPLLNDWKNLGHVNEGHAPQLRHLPEELAGPPDQANPSTTGKPRGSLNPAWVGQLMGYPDSWLDLDAKACERLATLWSRKSSARSGKRSERSA